jgi:hypothetical protein
MKPVPNALYVVTQARRPLNANREVEAVMPKVNTLPRAHDTDDVVHLSQFVTLAFDRPQTVFRLPAWRWPVLGAYNGFTGAERIRGWQLVSFYRRNGWLTVKDICSVTGRVGGTQLHNEEYSRPWSALPVSRRAHTLLHTRARFPNAWHSFLETEAMVDSWVHRLSPRNDYVSPEAGCSAQTLLASAPHPAWVTVAVNDFKGC